MSRRIPTWMRHDTCPRVKCSKFKWYSISGVMHFYLPDETYPQFKSRMKRYAETRKRTWRQINRRRR